MSIHFLNSEIAWRKKFNGDNRLINSVFNFSRGTRTHFTYIQTPEMNLLSDHVVQTIKP